MVENVTNVVLIYQWKAILSESDAVYEIFYWHINGACYYDQ